jgi:hypothetical protein
MPTQIMPTDPSGLGNIAEYLGTGLGTGISSGLQALAQQKIEAMQKKNLFQGLIGANVPPNVAQALLTAPKSMQRELVKPLLGLQQQQAAPQNQPGNADDLYKMRQQLFAHSKKTGKKIDVLKNQLLQMGTPIEKVESLLGSKLNDDAVRYFLSRTNNNPKKARALAKKFGYEV